jgi:CheY-like chemotaxis protein
MASKQKTLKVLIVEDDPAALYSIETILRRKYPDAVFYPAVDGKTGLQCFKEHLPDIVITDVIMPGMDGCQLAREIRKMKADTKLIMLTGLSKMSDFFESLMEGITIDHKVSKPIDLGCLLAAIDRCIADIDIHE